CCQHELFRQLRNDAMRPLLKHGILRERLNALVTDSLRANLLEIAGYAVQMLEFIDMEHTPKNLLIRAVKRDRDRSERRERLLTEYRTFRDFWGVTPTMETALESQLLLSPGVEREDESQNPSLPSPKFGKEGGEPALPSPKFGRGVGGEGA